MWGTVHALNFVVINVGALDEGLGRFTMDAFQHVFGWR